MVGRLGEREDRSEKRARLSESRKRQETLEKASKQQEEEGGQEERARAYPEIQCLFIETHTFVLFFTDRLSRSAFLTFPPFRSAPRLKFHLIEESGR